jgi:NAD(P)H-hydrate epimerase
MLSDQIKTKSSLPYSLYPAQQIKEFEGQAAASIDLSLYDLMKSAGEACYQVLKMHFPNVKRVLVLTGRGNNGGDGYIFATQAKQAGLSVQLFHLGDPGKLSGDAELAKQSWLIEKGEIEHIEQIDFASADVIVDALLGTGLSGPLRVDYQRLICKINQSDKPVLSVDIPSGLNADNGTINDVAVKAVATVTFVGLKQGLFTGRAAEYCGQIYFSGLGITDQFALLAKSDVTRVAYQQLSQILTPRNRVSHKGAFGRTLLIGGNLGMPGAIRLAAEACLRTGSGLVKVLTRSENQDVVMSGRPELMLAQVDIESLDEMSLSNWATNLVVGPGLGHDDWAKKLFNAAFETDLSLVLDADGLNFLAENPARRDHWILTPHPGEAARLLGCSVAKIEQDRFAAVSELQAIFGGVVVLKGAGTLICDGKRTYIANVGNPGMASGGMGDVLSGIIGGLLAQGLDLLQATMLAVCIHGVAGDLAAEKDERGLLASDLFPYIRKLVNPK